MQRFPVPIFNYKWKKGLSIISTGKTKPRGRIIYKIECLRKKANNYLQQKIILQYDEENGKVLLIYIFSLFNLGKVI